MRENEKKAYDFAADTTKQLITLATGIIALTITFSKDIIGASKLTNSNLIFWSWGLFIFSVFCGIWTLMALTGNLQPMIRQNSNNNGNVENEDSDNQTTSSVIVADIQCLDINTKNIKIPSVLQMFSFIFALILTVVFGAKSIQNADINNSETSSKDELEIIKHTEYKIAKPVKDEKIIYQSK